MSKFYKLEEMGTIGRGKSKHRPRNDEKLFGGKYPFVQTGDVKKANFFLTDFEETYNDIGLAQSKLWDEGTLCITIAANIAETAVLGIKACFPDSIIGFTPHKGKSDVKYIKYCLETYKLQMQALSLGATQDNLSLEKIRSLNFKMADFEEQKRIANVLFNYDQLIENNNKRISILEQMAEQLYKEWFVRMRFPGYEDVKFVKGVPEGWKIIDFKDFITLKRGYDLPNEKMTHGEYPVVASTSVKGFHSEYKVEPPVIVTGRSGTLGKVQYLEKQSWPLNTTLYVKEFNQNSPKYIYYTLKNLELANFNSGAGVPTLNRNHLNAIKICLPSDKMQVLFESKVETIFKKINIIQGMNENLNNTKNLILPRLISGQLSVKSVYNSNLQEV